MGDFRLIDSKIIQTVRNLNESNRFMKGLYAWPGFTSCEVDYVRPERSAGTTKWNYWKLWNFALDGIVSFSFFTITSMVIYWCWCGLFRAHLYGLYFS